MLKRRTFLLASLSFIFISLVIGPASLIKSAGALSASDWQAGRIIDDGIFTDSTSMSASQIQTFLNNQVPNCDTNGTQPATDWGRSDLTHAQFATQVKGWPGPPYVCLRNYYEVPKTTPGAGVPDNSYNHGGNPPAGSISAAQMIYNAAQQYHISPKVLLIKIRSESAGPLTNDTWPLQSQYIYAMGAHCPDSGPNHSANCDPNYAGFSIQISEAAGLLRYYLDNMNQSWWPYKKLGNNVIQYNPEPSCGSSTVNIVTSATAALYTYTPYQPNPGALAAGYGTAPCGAYGNRNFWLYFNEWFGSPTSACGAGSNIPGAPSGGQVLTYKYSDTSTTSLAYTQLNNTGSGCAEVHVWNPGYQSWATHIASGMGATDPTKGMLVTMSPGNGKKSNLAYILYSGGGTAVEVHKLSPDLQKFPGYYDVATNLSGVSPATGTFVSGDFFGRGTDQLAYVLYSNGTGHVEVHMFDPTLQRAVGYYDVATNLSNVTSTSGSFVAGDFLGRGYDQLAYVIYQGNNGRAEVHLFDPTLQRAVGYYDVATNLAGTSTSTGKFVAGDFLGRGYDQLEYVSYTGSTTMVETHLFNQALTQGVGYQDISTNLPGFDPTR